MKRQSNLKEIVQDGINSGEITSENGVIEALDSYKESFGLSDNDPVIENVWAWFQANKEKLLK
jgi:hypothetical protein